MPPLQKAGLAPSYFRLVLPCIKGWEGNLLCTIRTLVAKNVSFVGNVGDKSGLIFSDTLRPIRISLIIHCKCFDFCSSLRPLILHTIYRFCPLSSESSRPFGSMFWPQMHVVQREVSRGCLVASSLFTKPLSENFNLQICATDCFDPRCMLFRERSQGVV